MDLASQSRAELSQGDDAPPVNLPATFLNPLEAQQLRTYQGWLEREGLSSQLECISCGTACKAFITTGDIGIFCDCRVMVSAIG